MACVLAVNWTAKPGNETEVREILEALGAKSRREPGALAYTTHVDPDDPRELFIYEKYRDEAAFEAHQQSPHFRHYVLERAIPLLKSRVRRQLVDFGE